MARVQKIKKLLIYLTLILILEVLVIFASPINYRMERALLSQSRMVTTENNLLVQFISVGQGDAIAINLPNGELMLIDTGPKNKNVTYTNHLEKSVLNSRNDKIIDYLILTHADLDHIGGTLRLLKNFQIKHLFMPKIPSNSKYFQELQEFLVGKYEYDFLDGQDIVDLGECEFRLFDTGIETNTNDSSAVVKLEYLDKSFLFTGDISSRAEEKLLEKYSVQLDSDVLKVAHHGSKTSSSSEFLDVVSPKYSVISVGDNNYGHPTAEVLDRISVVGSEILRTDRDGSILFVVGENVDLGYLTDSYVVMGITFDVRFYSFVGVVVLFINAIIVVTKRRIVHKKTIVL